MFTLVFWRSAAERAVRAAAASAAAVMTADGFNLAEADLGAIALGAATGAVVSVLLSLVASGVGGEGPGLTETPTANVAALKQGGAVVAGPASPVKDGEPVTVQPVQR